MTSPRLFFDDLVFPEGIRWREDGLWVADQHAHKVWRIGSDGKGEVICVLDDMPSGLGFTPDGSVLVAEMRTQKIHRIAPDGTMTLHADLAVLRPGWINDMVVDGRGRAYVGHLTGKYALPSDGHDELVAVELDGSIRVVADNLAGPNGTAVTPDNRTMILAESAQQRLLAFDIEDDGSLKGRRVWAEGIHSDGICLDAEGGVWVGSPAESRFKRVVKGGAVTDFIEVTDWAIACTLGGLGRDTLYMLVTRATAETFADMADPGRDHLSNARGRVETCKVNIPGAGWP
ncbi:SMP-30/gluconolactonase/LRE family protein [Sphingopyxis flava]|uniref:Gluconolactonase n=1 Tax=Sphingopyxis flava TaxID=1507287 RepID=A0A1T5GN52_9SPHN|nr:SMP-30/gluconolactonase/LRE family protein [Sphingopyxis flava]SKC09846.1 gluconolactonase [Sphingopyxis flava]